MKTVNAVRCHYDTGGYRNQGLCETINEIGIENVFQIIPCYCGNGMYFYTIIYDADVYIQPGSFREEW